MLKVRTDEKYSRLMVNAEPLEMLVKMWGDVHQPFWMGDFGDNPPKLIF